ncbi:MAG: YkgJ family cysteine cluster protein [Acidobacteriota bacterium]|nr:YkgJ family cysteine cluster protein [Acidobacteriota bacterium]
MAISLRVDPEQRFSCASCARCCRRWEILVSPAEVAAFAERNAAQWFRLDAAEGSDGDPFEPIAGWRGYQRIRRRPDGACGFLSEANRCRLHEELGERRKPLTCRMFPFEFHSAPEAVVVTTSFGCPTVVANRGARIADAAPLATIKALRTESLMQHHQAAPPRMLVAGRVIEARSLAILREGLLMILDREDAGVRDLRRNVRRMAAVLDDLTRSRVTRLADADFAEYIRLTVPYAAADQKAVAPRRASAIGRLLQRGFLFVVAAMRLKLDHPAMSRITLRLKTFWLLAHLHGLAPKVDRVDVSALALRPVDLNAPGVQPIAYHYLRASLESLGARERLVLDDLAIAVSALNAACALAAMNGEAGTFAEALMEAVDVSHAGDRGLLGRVVGRLAGGTEALYTLTSAGP